jgi:hypothetical protein
MEERRVVEAKMRAGKRRSEVEEMRELVWEVYSAMKFEAVERGGESCWRCCVVM